jgi:superfamily II DNA or RNA helicase
VPKPPAPAAAPTLTAELAQWLRSLRDGEATDDDAYPATVSKRLFYRLGQVTPFGRYAPMLSVQLASSDMRRDGSFNTRFSTPDLRQLIQSDSLKYLRPSDRSILRRLTVSNLIDADCDAAVALRDILATDRARLGEFPGVQARLAEPRPGAVEWQMDEDGSQRPRLIVEGNAAPVFAGGAWYLDSTSGEVGPVSIGVSPTVLQRLLNAPPVPPSQAGLLRQAMANSLPSAAVPPPIELPHGGDITGPPVPCLQLQRLSLFHGQEEARLGAASATLSFRYGGLDVAENAPAADTERVRAGIRYTLKRDRKAEAGFVSELTDIGFHRLHQAMRWGAPPAMRDRLVLAGGDPIAQWLDFMMESAPELRARGWQLNAAADFPHNLITPTSPMQAELKEGSGIDWFDLDLGVMVGDERIDLVPPILALLSRPDAATLVEMLSDPDEEAGQRMVLSLKDGRQLVMEIAALRPVLLTLFDLFGAGGVVAGDGSFRVSRQGAADVAALEDAGLAANLVWRGGEALRALGKLLRTRGGLSAVAVPGWFKADLRPYQQQGVDWLQFLREAGLAGVLADDMGLGKTVQTLAHLCVEKQQGRLTEPALVICPTSVVGNWAREAARFAPTLRVLPLQGNDRKARFGEIAQADLVISTYPLLARDGEVLDAQEWHVLILDEAQTVKNPAAGMARMVRQLRARQRICLTGTPMENHLGELWALFDFMMPGFLGSAKDFNSRFRTPIEKAGDTDRHAALAKRVSPFLLRRTKAEVVTELPPRTDIIETIRMEKAQRAVYDGIRLAMHARVQAAIAEKGLAKSGIVILDALLKLRQACCDPRLLKIAGTASKKAGSAKLERLLELLTTALDEGRSLLLFSQFTSMLALIEAELVARRIPFVQLTGETKDRDTPVRQFQEGRVKLFLISLKAGGVGLNLTAADTVIHYDPWWNPAVENQATDRAHRIGQTKKVFVHRLITEDTIEEKMEGLKAKKSALAEGILSGAGASALKMTEADVEMLFS